MLGPHLTAENHLEVLARAKHRTKVELTKLLRTLNPSPELPARIEPLAPAPAQRTNMNPSWGDYIAAWAPVRELQPGDALRDWMNDVLPGSAADQPAPARPEPAEATPPEPAPARSEMTPVTGPLRYGVQFSANDEYVQLVERAKALLSHAHGKSALEEIHLRAMRLLVADLETRRFAKLARPRQKRRAVRDAAVEFEGLGTPEQPSGSSGSNERCPTAPSENEASKWNSEPAVLAAPNKADASHEATARGRYIPAAVRREVFERDAARCTFVDSAGRRCRETHDLELHHLVAFALGGDHHADNVTLRCRAHNALAAERDFGRYFIAQKRAHHERFGGG